MHHYLGIQKNMDAKRALKEQSPWLQLSMQHLESELSPKANTIVYYNAQYSKDILLFKHRYQQFSDPNYVHNFMNRPDDIGGWYLIETLIDWGFYR
jgi:hypothetical protein